MRTSISKDVSVTLVSESETTGLAIMVGNRDMGVWLFYADSR
jgi:hypothetical protein